jgi:hypothetical protein
MEDRNMNATNWPLPPQHRAIQSVMLQNGIGSLHCSRWRSLTFTLERNVIDVGSNGTVHIEQSRSGRKTGSR